MARPYFLSFPCSYFLEVVGGRGWFPLVNSHHVFSFKQDLDLILGYWGSSKTVKRVCSLDSTIVRLSGILRMFFIFNTGRYGRTARSKGNDTELIVQYNVTHDMTSLLHVMCLYNELLPQWCSIAGISRFFLQWHRI